MKAKVSGALLPDCEALKQQLAESRAREREVSENLASMQEKHKSLMDAHDAMQEAFQQVRMNREWRATNYVLYH